MRFKIPGKFPSSRMRRNRRHDWTRRLVAENRLSPDDFILPIFVGIGKSRREPIPSMPGVDRISIDLLDEVVGEAKEAGIPAVVIFPEVDPKTKTPDAREAYNPENLVYQSTSFFGALTMTFSSGTFFLNWFLTESFRFGPEFAQKCIELFF